MIKLLHTLIVFFVSISLFAQDFDNYKPIRCQGDVPSEFYSEDLLVTTSDIGKTGPNASYSEIKSKQEFIMYSDFFLRYLLHSGDLMFGDPLTNYVNKVADQLLKDFPEVREKFRFYVTRYPEVNAACLPNGIVLVNIGFLAQLENEAQLAFGLAHEIIHYIKKHGIDTYIEQNRIRRNVGEYKKVRKSDRMFAMLQYQKDKEFEADELGFRDYFSKSGYKLSEAEAVCDVLLYSDFPVDEIPVMRSEFEDEWFHLTNTLWLDTVDVITAIEDYDDEKMTHPNIKKRREKLSNLLTEFDNTGSDFIFPSEEFFGIREIARFELVQLYLTDRKYVDAIYLIHVLQQTHPTSKYLNSAKAKAYYGLMRLKKERNKSKAITFSSKIKGESQRLFYLFKHMSNKELVTVCVREIWKAHLADPDDTRIIAMEREALNDLMSNCSVADGYFTFKEPVAADTVKTVDTTASSKYDKIKQNQKKASQSDNFTYAFLSFAQDKKFRELFNEASKSEDDTFILENKKHLNIYVNRDPSLGNVSDIMVFDPTYLRISESRKSGDRYFATSKYERTFIQMVNEASGTAGIKTTMMEVGSMNAGDEDKYNKFQILQSWINELPEDDEDGSSFISSNQEVLDALCEDMGTNYIGLTGIYTLRSKHEVQLWMFYLLMAPPVYPLLAAYLLSPKYETLYYFYLYDIHTGKRVYTEVSLVKSRDYKYTVKDMIYTTMMRLSKPGKNKRQ